MEEKKTIFGRPPKPQYRDGAYHESEIENLIYHHSDFKKETELQNHVVMHINEIIGDVITGVETEVIYPKNRPRQKSKVRMDIVAVSEEAHYLIECKVPNANAIVYLTSGVAQLQLYGVIYEHIHNIKPKLILVCSKINEYLTNYMAKFAPDVSLIIVGADYDIRMQHG